MLDSHVILFAWLLGGLELSYLVAARWPQRTTSTALAVIGTSLIIWLLLGARLPAVPAAAETFPSSTILWNWLGGESTWLLSGVLLLFLFSLLLYRFGQSDDSVLLFAVSG